MHLQTFFKKNGLNPRKAKIGVTFGAFGDAFSDTWMEILNFQECEMHHQGWKEHFHIMSFGSKAQLTSQIHIIVKYWIGDAGWIRRSCCKLPLRYTTIHLIAFWCYFSDWDTNWHTLLSEKKIFDLLKITYYNALSIEWYKLRS